MLLPGSLLAKKHRNTSPKSSQEKAGIDHQVTQMQIALWFLFFRVVVGLSFLWGPRITNPLQSLLAYLAIYSTIAIGMHFRSRVVYTVFLLWEGFITSWVMYDLVSLHETQLVSSLALQGVSLYFFFRGMMASYEYHRIVKDRQAPEPSATEQ